MLKTSYSTIKSVSTFDKILSAAVKLFKKNGFYNTTVRQIAKESGLEEGSLYYYFHTKEELILSFYEKINKEIIEKFKSAIKSDPKFPHIVQIYLNVKLSMLAPYKDLLKILMKEAIDPDSSISPFSKGSWKTLKTNLDLFKDLAEKSGFAKGDEAVNVAKGLWIAHMGIITFWIHDKSKEGKATEEVIQIFTELLSLSAVVSAIPGLGKFRKKILEKISQIMPDYGGK